MDLGQKVGRFGGGTRKKGNCGEDVLYERRKKEEKKLMHTNMLISSWCMF